MRAWLGSLLHDVEPRDPRASFGGWHVAVSTRIVVVLPAPFGPESRNLALFDREADVVTSVTGAGPFFRQVLDFYHRSPSVRSALIRRNFHSASRL